ncbi:MAG: GIY-YIG nuclease family protein [Pelagibacteraceae bacterium]|jgi:putative endonuclease|nr:excinuclease ABC subunit C [Candidatus Pelagibacter sp.]MDP6680138.1 GIY-YIG nuclease family protein [Pelagibacteraceae bacterium]MDP6710170.1 GIY-YIG nuclease family protein [Pelagibacteraceae bacterium]|tara:strand:+ start:136 stop:387 length:252 start_codon:yes stop_codon:yes gene_type:complete
MDYFVYVLGTYKNSKLITYVGYTNNLRKRLYLHNKGRGAKFTRGRKWKVIYIEKYFTKKAAIIRECYIKKNRKLRNTIRNINI